MPFEKPDIVAVVVALAAHAGLAYGLAHVPERPPHRPSWVEVEMRKKKPPPPKQVVLPEPPKPPPPKIVKKAPPPEAPHPNKEPPPEPPKEPPKPVFGVTMSSTTEGDSSISVPVGNTTMIDPKNSGKGPAVPLPAAPPSPPKAEYKPVSELYIKSMPDIDSDACGKSIQYPAEAEQLGVEGDVKLRVELDEKGKVHGIRVLNGLGHGLDQAAVWALTHKCKFTPAIATDGKAVPYVIPAYVFHFEIPR